MIETLKKFMNKLSTLKNVTNYHDNLIANLIDQDEIIAYLKVAF